MCWAPKVPGRTPNWLAPTSNLLTFRRRRQARSYPSALVLVLVGYSHAGAVPLEPVPLELGNAAVVAGAVWYATGSLDSVYTAAEYSIWSFEHGALAPPWHAIAASSGVLSRDLAKAGALARRSWFTSCLGLSDMPIPTPTEHLPPQSTRYSSCSSRGLHAHGV